MNILETNFDKDRVAIITIEAILDPKETWHYLRTQCRLELKFTMQFPKKSI